MNFPIANRSGVAGYVLGGVRSNQTAGATLSNPG